MCKRSCRVSRTLIDVKVEYDHAKVKECYFGRQRTM